MYPKFLLGSTPTQIVSTSSKILLVFLQFRSTSQVNSYPSGLKTGKKYQSTPSKSSSPSGRAWMSASMV